MYFRGVSSVVRRCVHRHTGQELAVKIIEITAEKMTAQQLEEVKTSTLKEIQVLNMVKGHPSISRLDHVDVYSLIFLEGSIVMMPCHVLFLLVTLIDSYESTTFIFLVFDLWVLQQRATLQLVIRLVHRFHPNMLKMLVFIRSMRRGELFDYLTEKVTLSEKETR